jgi:C-terminal processing protease CtpA/Prc
MPQLTRRGVIAAAGAAASGLGSFSGIRPAAGQIPCPTKSVKDFLADAKAQALSLQDRIEIVDQAVALFNDFYVHLPLKRVTYAVDPLERLRLLRQRLPQLPGDLAFHAEMTDIFASLRDLHTLYFLPEPYASAHAWLPFKVEACVEAGQRKYIVSRIVDGFLHPSFRVGVEVLSFDGLPVARAAELAGRQGSNSAAQHALGLARLTYRALIWAPPPQEDSVLIHYRVGARELKISIPWNVSTLSSNCDDKGDSCNEVEQIQRFRRFLFAPSDPCHPFGIPERITTSDGVFGYIRIFSFDKNLLSGGDEEFVQRFKKLVAGFVGNTKGLIVDVRDNGGGSTRAAERVVQYVRPATTKIDPTRLYFVATPVTLQFCQLSSTSDLGPTGLAPWIPSIQQALQNHGAFSDAFQYTSDDACNDQPRRVYPGPVIVVTNALSYSSAEFFIAGFQDHGGTILGVDETTGGAGAGVRTHQQLHQYFVDAGQPSPFKPLPNAGLSTAFRRTVRVGIGVGREIEDSGVSRNRPYVMTRDDLLNHNVDLKREAARLLAQMT